MHFQPSSSFQRDNTLRRPGGLVAVRDDGLDALIDAHIVLLVRIVVVGAVAEVLAHLEVAGDAALDATIWGNILIKS
jgi:hypothetical protein